MTGLSCLVAYYLYIIQSDKDGSFHIGTTQDLEERILRHNQGRSKYTKTKGPWRLIYHEEHRDRSSAMKREYAIKGRKSTLWLDEADFVITVSSGIMNRVMVSVFAPHESGPEDGRKDIKNGKISTQ